MTTPALVRPVSRAAGRAGLAGLVLALGVGAVVGAANRASAAPVLRVQAPTNLRITPGIAHFALTGMTLTGAASANELVQVTLSTTVGTLDLGAHDGLTLAYANHWSGEAAITFRGPPSAINTALAAAELATTTADANSTAILSLTAQEYEANLYLAPNGNFYQYVPDYMIDWDAAKVAAEGMTYGGQSGYLARIPTQAVNDFISTRVQNANNVWIGAESTDTPGSTPARTWQWVGGPLGDVPFDYCSAFDARYVIGAGVVGCDSTPDAHEYTSWADGEPNNTNNSGTPHSGEWVAVTNWQGTAGMWNDLNATPDPGDPNHISGYLVEYGDHASGSTYAGVATDSASIPVIDVPAAPNVTATRGNRMVSLTWSAPDDHGSAITRYTVSYSPGGTARPCASPCSISGLINGEVYTFAVQATNSIGPGWTGYARSVPATRPNAPTRVEVAARDGGVLVRFHASAVDGGAAVTGYTVSAWPDGATTTCPASPCRVAGLTNGAAYTFTVHATNAVGDSVESGVSAAVYPAGVPGRPRSLVAKAGDRIARVRFAAPVRDGGARLTGYQVSSDRKHWTNLPVRSRHAVLRALLNGRSYRVAVRAVNAAGSGPAATTRVRLAAWFHDPLRGRRAGELRVPSDPAAYQGPLRWTTARNRSHDGSAAIGTGALRDRQLQPGQAVGLGTDALFAFDSPALDAAGRRAIKAIVRSLRYVSKVVCEGYADYGGSDSREVTLSRQRAETVCAALRASGVHVVTAAVGYGSARPVRVGGSHAQRAANRRVIVRITR